MYALKEMLPMKFEKEGRLKEVFIEKCVLKGLKHESVVDLMTSFSSNGKLYLLLQYCSGGSLADFLRKQTTLTVPLARHFTAELVDALSFLRSQQIIHRDLKPGNIVLGKDNHMKLIDFATCKVFNAAINEDIAKLTK